MTCGKHSTGPGTPYTCQLPDGHDHDRIHGAVVSNLNIAVWGPGHGWGVTYAPHRCSPGAPTAERAVLEYLAREYAAGRLLPHDKAVRVASFVTSVNRGHSVVFDRPGRAGRTMTEAAHTWRDAWWCELPEDLRRVQVVVTDWTDAS